VAADALVEEHLLACEECRARPAGFDAYIAATRETARSDA
jgi:predicted anti-sigma-YlaC factor YlaD